MIILLENGQKREEKNEITKVETSSLANIHNNSKF